MRTHITSSIKVEVVLPDKWTESVKYTLLTDVEGVTTVVPAGFATDGATVPRFLWGIFPPVGRYFTATLVHDYLLDASANRDIADTAFKIELEALGVAKWRIFVMYTAVRLYSKIKSF